MTDALHTYDDTVVIPAISQTLKVVDNAATKYTKCESLHHCDSPEILADADRVLCCMSTGKDSWAMVLHLLDIGVPKEKIELWHHRIDGAEGSDLFDWQFVDSYAEKLAEALGLPLYFSWLEGGLEGELTKQDAVSKGYYVDTPDGTIHVPRTARSKPNTRMRFPQQAASLMTRWCSAVGKIDCGRRAITSQTRFTGQKLVFCTGERTAESAARSKYFQLEPHATSTQSRRVDHWRPVLHWSEEQVWDKLAEHGVIAPVPYRLGWGRSSCQICIFQSDTLWATLNEVFPETVQRVADYEREFGTSIARSGLNVQERAAAAQALKIEDTEALAQALRKDYVLPVMGATGSNWVLPAGAFSSESAGSL